MADNELTPLEAELKRMLEEMETLARQAAAVRDPDDRARMLSEIALMASQATAIQNQIGAPDPEPGDWRPRPSTPQPPYDPPAVYGNGGGDLDSPDT